MTQKLITMTLKEIDRGDIIQNLIDKTINASQAAIKIGLSVRQVQRLKVKVKDGGTKSLAHGNRGKPSNRRLNDKIITEAIDLIKENYSDFGPTLACEKLKENHDINIGKETLRQLMIREKIWKSKKRKQPKNIHLWRPRKDYFGEMSQFDGSYHLWFENRSSEACLLLAIDDATGKITHAKFDLNESIKAVFNFWIEYFEKNGAPVSIYLDKFSTYKVNHKNATDNKDLLTQFQRAMKQIGVKTISAHSPQAKGRVERAFKTLQDRLVKELRLANISNIEDGNKFLENYISKFNNQFAVEPNKKEDLHKKINKSLEEKIPQIFSIQSERLVQNDYTIMFKNKYYQLERTQPTTVYKKNTVIVEEHLNGEIKINLKGHYLNYILLPERPKKQINVKLPALTKVVQTNWKPPKNHPWRNQYLLTKRSKVNIKKKVNSN